MSQPKVSVVIVTFNQERFVEQALDGVVSQQTDFDIEVIVSDDHSTDRTPDLIRRYARQHPQLVRPILRTENVGVMTNVVEALQQVQGEYISLCEGDDFWTDDTKLQRQADLLDKRPELGMCFHPVRILDEETGNADRLFPRPADSRGFTLNRLVERNFIQTNSVMYRRLDYSSLPTDVMPLDWYLHLLHSTAGEIGFLEREMATYRRHAGGVWFGTADKIVERTRKYGLAQLGFSHATLRLLDGANVSLEPVRERILAMYQALGEADRVDGSDLLAQGFASYPNCASFALDSLQAELESVKPRAAFAAELERELRTERANYEALMTKYRRTRRRLAKAHAVAEERESVAARRQLEHGSAARCARTALQQGVQALRRRMR